MSKIPTSTNSAPAAIGPYSQAITVGRLVFTSGQIALDPVTNQLIGGGDVEVETLQVLANLTAVLHAAGATWDDVVKTTIYLTDLAHFAAVNRLYGALAGAVPPARSTVQVAALPRNALVEIDAIAHIHGASASAP